MANKEELYDSYAKGFFEIAAAEGVAEKLGDELGQIKSVLNSNLELREFFFNKEIESGKRIRALIELFQGKLSNLVQNLVLFILEKGKMEWLEGVVRAYGKQVEERFGVVEVEVTTAYPIGKDEIGKLENKLENILKKKTWIRSKVDPSVIGGLKLKIGHKLWDSTVKNYLSGMKESLLKG